MTDVRLIGVGIGDTGEEAAGLAAVRRAAARLPTEVRVVESQGDGTALMDAWGGADVAIVVDVVSTGAPPGTVHRLDARAQDVADCPFQGSRHAADLAEAVGWSRALGQLPPVLLLYGVEGSRELADATPSRKLRRGVVTLAHELEEEVLRRTGSSTSTGGCR